MPAEAAPQTAFPLCQQRALGGGGCRTRGGEGAVGPVVGGAVPGHCTQWDAVSAPGFVEAVPNGTCWETVGGRLLGRLRCTHWEMCSRFPAQPGTPLAPPTSVAWALPGAHCRTVGTGHLCTVRHLLTPGKRQLPPGLTTQAALHPGSRLARAARTGAASPPRTPRIPRTCHLAPLLPARLQARAAGPCLSTRQPMELSCAAPRVGRLYGPPCSLQTDGGRSRGATAGPGVAGEA